MDLSQLKPVTAKEIVAHFAESIQAPETPETPVSEERLKELDGMTKKDLIAAIVGYESKPAKGGTKVAEIVKEILLTEQFVTADHNTIAEAVKQLLPGSKTTAKSVASYISKNGAAWNILPRIAMKQPKPKAVETPAVEATAEVPEDTLEEAPVEAPVEA